MKNPGWRKSSSSQSAGQCVEVGGGLDTVRDSKNPAGPFLVVGTPGLRALLALVKSARTE
ncbi:DUF397 domain-containing protein [Actinokineospora sp.]|uniref:DUF397 domain-containing protein n=1 Tax=Actinokineospora sp. TaxID=1872133 RepID=UPI003D6AC7F7